MLKEQFDNLEVHYVTIPDSIGPYTNLEEMFNILETPPNMFHYTESSLFAKARDLNIRCLLTGFGGDMTISSRGSGIIYHYLMKLNFKKAIELFIQKRNKSDVGIITLVKSEILNFNPLYRILRFIIKKSDYNSFIALNKYYLKKLKINSEKENLVFKKCLRKHVNNGGVASDLIQFRKHAIHFHLEFQSPMLNKDVCELFMSIPEELFDLNNVNRNFIKQLSHSKVPIDIIQRGR